MTGQPTLTVALDDGTGTYPYDVTSRLRLELGVTITSGRTDELSTIAPGALSMSLSNADGALTLGSATYGVRVGQGVRVTATVGGVTRTRFVGTAESWSVSWPDGGDSDAVANLTAVDDLARLGRVVFDTLMTEQIDSGGVPLAWWPMGEGSNAKRAGEFNGGPALVKVSGSGKPPAFGSEGGPVTGGTAALFKATESVLQGSLTQGQPMGQLVVEAVVTVAEAGSATGNIAKVSGADDSMRIYLDASAIPFWAAEVAALSYTYTLYGGFSTAGTHHLAVRVTPGFTRRMEFYVDGAMVDAMDSAVGVQVDVAETIKVGGIDGAISQVVISDSSGVTSAVLANHSHAALDGFSADSTAVRAQRYAAFAGRTLTIRTAASTSSMGSLDIAGLNALDAIGRVVTTEGGTLSRDPAGGLIFDGRTYRPNRTVTWTLDADDIDGSTEPVADTSTLLNDITVDQFDGGTTRVKSPASIAAYGLASGTLDLLTSDDAAARNRAEWEVSSYSTIYPRVGSLTIDVGSLATAKATGWLDVGTSTRMRVTGLPSQAPGVVAGGADFLVEGWSETVTHESWTTSLNVSPWEVARAWRLNDTTDSVLGTSTRLYY